MEAVGVCRNTETEADVQFMCSSFVVSAIRNGGNLFQGEPKGNELRPNCKCLPANAQRR